MKNKKKKFNLSSKTIIIILIIIIILLLLFCGFYAKIVEQKYMERFTGKSDIFEINCDCAPTFGVYDENISWKSHNKVNIFKSATYKLEDKIVPGDSNSYVFVVSNNTDCDMKYTILFGEDNFWKINMQYRLKKNGKYVVDKWSNYSNLIQEEIFIKANSKDSYVLEWRWNDEDDYSDTKAGIAEAEYSLTIDISGKQVV